jgi:glycine/D-amino acid oxidase-like deaminating enzyme
MRSVVSDHDEETERTIHDWPWIGHESDARLQRFAIPGVSDRELILRRDVGPYLVAFAAQYHRRIAPLDHGTMDVWSWVERRPGRASSRISDHCGGIAIDLNATKEGAQDRSNFESFWRQPRTWERLQKLRAEFPLLEWGGDYESFYDPMHWTFRHGVGREDVLADISRQGLGIE